MESSLSLYLREIGRFPLLNAEQELELGRRIKDEQDQEARQELINSNLRLVVSVAKPFRNGNHNIPLEDLIAEGNIGLITAVDKYDYERGFRFSTCAVPWIKQAIMKAIVDKSRVVRIPAHIIKKFNQYRDVLDELLAEGEADPTNAMIAARMGISEDELGQLLQWRMNSASLETPLDEDDGDTLGDLCADEHDLSPTDYTSQQLNHDLIVKLLHGLDARTMAIMKLRFGLGEEGDPEEYFQEHTLEEIGELITPRITRERVRQIVTQQIARWKLVCNDLN